MASDPLILHGHRGAGTRVTVSVVLDRLAAGMSEAEILGEYQSLTGRRDAGVRPLQALTERSPARLRQSG